MNEDHEPGKCYACKQYKPVRWKNLYTIGSEGTNLCIECETITVKFVRHLADKAQQSKAAAIKERKKGKV